MKNTLLVSVIIPVYNCESTLQRCVDSVLYQSYKNIEVLLIDDGSTDNSLEICNSYLKNNSNVTVQHFENSGVSSTRNKGLELAKGQYITFVDSDDYLDSECIGTLLGACLNKEVDIAYCSYYIVENNETKRAINASSTFVEKSDALNVYSPLYSSSVWGKLFKRELLQDLRFQTDMYYGEDTIFYLSAVCKSKSIYYCDSPLYYYCINPKGAMESYSYEKRKSEFFSRVVIKKLLGDYCGLDSEQFINASSEVFIYASYFKRLFFKHHWNDKAFKKNINAECRANKKYYLHNKHFSLSTRVARSISSATWISWLISKVS